MSIKIETVSEANFDKILPLIAKYQEFYDQKPNLEQNRKFFSQFLSIHDAGVMFLAVDPNGIAVGFSTLYFTFSSTSASKISILNDLYVDENIKIASGIRTTGFSLIRHCFDYSLNRNIFKIVGTTDFDNIRAQRLYDTLPHRIKDFTIEKNNVFEYVVKHLDH